MSENKVLEEKKETKRNKKKPMQSFLTKKVISLAILVGVIATIGFGLKNTLFIDSKVTRLKFENIGELATQASYSSVVNLTDRSREIFGIEIPFTQTKYVYSYDVKIKAGLDFSDIVWSIDEKEKIIHIQIPEIKTLSNEIVLDSLKVYHESESIFTNVTLKDDNAALVDLTTKAEETAIANGLYDNALENAKTLIKGFVGNVYDLNTYEIQFRELEEEK